MSNKNDGGSAFACAASNGHQAGMSLRSYMAGQALAGSLANPTFDDMTVSQHARSAWSMADAMLAERDKPVDSD